MCANDRSEKPSRRCVPATNLSLTAWTLTASEHPVKEKKLKGGASGCHRVEEEEEQEQEEERQQHGQQEGVH